MSGGVDIFYNSMISALGWFKHLKEFFLVFIVLFKESDAISTVSVDRLIFRCLLWRSLSRVYQDGINSITPSFAILYQKLSGDLQVNNGACGFS